MNPLIAQLFQALYNLIMASKEHHEAIVGFTSSPSPETRLRYDRANIQFDLVHNAARDLMENVHVEQQE